MDGIRGCVFCLVFWVGVVGLLFGWFVLVFCCCGSWFFFHPFLPSYKSYEAHDGLSEMGTRPGARGMTSLVRFVVVSLSVLDCQYPRDPPQPVGKKLEGSR